MTNSEYTTKLGFEYRCVENLQVENRKAWIRVEGSRDQVQQWGLLSSVGVEGLLVRGPFFVSSPVLNNSVWLLYLCVNGLELQTGAHVLCAQLPEAAVYLKWWRPLTGFFCALVSSIFYFFCMRLVSPLCHVITLSGIHIYQYLKKSETSVRQGNPGSSWQMRLTLVDSFPFPMCPNMSTFTVPFLCLLLEERE